MASGICGTDIHILPGHYLGAYPVIPGHEFAGIVEAIGPEVRRFAVGDRVAVEPNLSCDNCCHCLNNRQNFCENWQAIGVTLPGGMAQYTVAPEKAVFNIGNLPFRHGAFMEPLSCVLHGIERLQPNYSDQALILGAGPIGILLMQALRLKGVTHISILERQTARAEMAEQFGADRMVTDLQDLPTDVFDVVVDATGSIPMMAQTLNFVRAGGRVLLFGVPPQGEQLRLDGFTIFRKGLTILSSFTSLRNSFQAIALLQSARVQVEALISHALPLADFERGVELIERGIENVRKVMILPHA